MIEIWIIHGKIVHKITPIIGRSHPSVTYSQGASTAKARSCLDFKLNLSSVFGQQVVINSLMYSLQVLGPVIITYNKDFKNVLCNQCKEPDFVVEAIILQEAHFKIKYCTQD